MRNYDEGFADGFAAGGVVVLAVVCFSLLMGCVSNTPSRHAENPGPFDTRPARVENAR